MALTAEEPSKMGWGQGGEGRMKKLLGTREGKGFGMRTVEKRAEVSIVARLICSTVGCC